MRRDVRQTLGDERRAAVEDRGIERPVALQRAQMRGGVGDRGDRDLLRIEPDVLGPRGGAWRALGDQQAPVLALDRTQLVRELGEEPLGGEIGGAQDQPAARKSRTAAIWSASINAGA
jgi:hypothetical protein